MSVLTKSEAMPRVAKTADIPADRPYPSRLVVEPTTRCNLRCAMCVKQNGANSIAEGDISTETFEALAPVFPYLDALILTGIGEPLLHPLLDQFIERARRDLPASAWVGFQTNGRLLTPDRAESLVSAGLDRICLSVDAASPEVFRQVRAGGKLDDISRAFGSLRLAEKNTGRTIRAGIEFVLMERNLNELPRALEWAVQQGAAFALVTHMLPYGSDQFAEAAYSSNTDASVEFYDRWKQQAGQEGISIEQFFKVRWKYHKTDADKRIIDFVERMIAEADVRDIPFHLRNLIAEDPSRADSVQSVFEDARRVASQTGIELTLPAVRPAGARRCDFIEDGSAFVSWSGEVHPCYFLWHHYVCYPNGFRKAVAPTSFGNVRETDLLEIWNQPDYARFRDGVRRYDYPFCGNCSLSPCDLVDSEPFVHDCYTVEVPCGDCPWCLGLHQCLR